MTSSSQLNSEAASAATAIIQSDNTSKDTTNKIATQHLACDYLVIGAGTSGMSFVDTLLSYHESASIVIVDRNERAGGHWNKAYPFVRLHQPNCTYGVNSVPLGKTRDSKGRERENANDRATLTEIMEYFDEVTNKFLETGRVKCIFNTEYYQADNNNDNYHTLITSSSISDTKNNNNNDTTHDKIIYKVQCKKVVRCLSDVVVPSMRNGPSFPIDGNINIKTVNELPNEICQKKKYVIIGGGKTSCDAILYLLENGIDQSSITWIISRDCWFFLRNGIWRTNGEQTSKDKALFLKPFLKYNTITDIYLKLEKYGMVGRLQPNSEKIPKIFKVATIDETELLLLRSIQNVLRMGRITSINKETIILEKGEVPMQALLSSSSNNSNKNVNGNNHRNNNNNNFDTILFVDCMAENFYGYELIRSDFQIFEKGKINLGPFLQFFNVSFSAAIIAYVEATFEDEYDDLKNSFCYFAKGQYAKSDIQIMLVALYINIRTLDALGRYKPARDFIFDSRTYTDSPMHHGGLVRVLWGLFGPPRLLKKAEKFIKRVQNGEFGNDKNCFETSQQKEIPIKIPKCAIRKKKKKKKKKKQ